MATRRDVLAGALSVLFAGRAAAQGKIFRLAYLSGSGAEPHSGRALFGRLEELGYREGQNLVVDRRFAEGRLDRLPALAAELVALKPDILFATSTQPAVAASNATKTIPIVFAAVTDPVGLGLVRSLARPGTNATGFSNQLDELQIKILELIRDVFPSASRVGVLHDPQNIPEVRYLPAVKRAASTVGLNVTIVEARSPAELDQAFGAMKGQRPDVVYVLPGPLSYAQRRRIVEWANAERQPAVYSLSEFAEVGGLMSYSVSLVEQTRAAASFIDRILKGASPAALPVEQPTRFELIINLKTAKALGVTIPSVVLVRADRLIE